jgi:hypothetical protein
MTIKDTIASCLIIALGAILALHFTLFWLYGGVFIHETNRVILVIESVMSVAIIGFGVERLASAASAGYPRRASSSPPHSLRHQSTAEYTASPAFAPGARATSHSYAAATAVAPTARTLIKSASPSAEDRTIHVLNQPEHGGVILAHLTHTEHEPTMTTDDVFSLVSHQ